MFARNYSGSGSLSPLGALQRLARKKSASEQCDFCSVPLAVAHRHLLEVATRKIICACDACALRFENVVGGRWKLIPRDARLLPGLQISDSQWEGLALPIDLAFIFYSTPQQKSIALYPSPAGVIESLLPLESWKDILAHNPQLHDMQPDTEALLARKACTNREYYIAPIDKCFELAGVIRMHWRGLAGGKEVWSQVDAFFSQLKDHLRPRLHPEVSHA